MHRTLWPAVACMLIAASSTSLRAQQPTQPAHDSTADSTHAMPPAAAPAGQNAAAEHANMMDVQNAAIAAATQAGTLAAASPLDRAAIAAQATTARDNLQTIVTHLQSAQAAATGTQKSQIAAVLAHEQEALHMAKELLEAANKKNSTAADLSTRAKGVLDHANAANAAMPSHDQ